ncbi:uncharacterized protein LOC135498820 [Lineus longissimus]|uniref:uncharacterized protein LOC135498820 n=1 Tax=Lineus longissimus TaxID=88925 RepID=UPI00315CF379
MCFHFHFMDLRRVIYLQGTIPVMDLCEAFKHLYSPYVHFEDPAIQNIYRVLINESFEEYRAFIYQCDYLRDVCPDFGDGTVCPACPMEDDYPVIISMDGNFGLVRKKSSGVSFSEPKHAGHFFSNQSEVDEFVQKHNGSMKNAGDACSNFKGGNTLRTNSRYEKLDETAVFGSACRHEVPVIMFSLKHGESVQVLVVF